MRHRPLKIACCEADDSIKWKGLTLKYCRDSFSFHEEDTITLFDCAGKGEFPSVHDIENRLFDVLFIGGSHFSAYEQEPWIVKLRELIPVYVASRKVKIVGLCFGHQILAHSLGGRVGKNPEPGRFVLKVEEIDFDTSALEQYGLGFEESEGKVVTVSDPSTAGVGSPRSSIRLKLIESHGDQVLQMPPGAFVLATSATAHCEMLTIPGVVLSCQGHPEFPGTDVVIEKIHSALSASGRLDKEESAASLASLTEQAPDSLVIRKLFRSFMEK